MARFIKTCRVCGKEYEACRTPRVDGVYHWQEVACCPEHGAIYLEEVLRARGIITEEEPDEVEEDLFADDDEDDYEDEEFDEDEDVLVETEE